MGKLSIRVAMFYLGCDERVDRLAFAPWLISSESTVAERDAVDVNISDLVSQIHHVQGAAEEAKRHCVVNLWYFCHSVRATSCGISRRPSHIQVPPFAPAPSHRDHRSRTAGYACVCRGNK
jgi:hypothetical protein